MGYPSTRHWQHNAAAILVAAILCTASNAARAQLPAPPSPETIAKGKALTEAADAASCHTAYPAKPFAGGKRIDTPFGAVYSANLTPDLNTGIGRWTDEAFLRAMRYGARPDGKNDYQAFPSPHYTKVIGDDVFAIRAYLHTLAPINNPPPPSELY